MAPTYSPITPRKTSCSDAMKKTPMTMGARPKLKVYQKSELEDEVDEGDEEGAAAPRKPAKTARRSGTFEWLMMPSMPMS